MQATRWIVAVPIALCLGLTAGCANKARTGALVGTGVGTGVGAIIGHQIGKGKEGALIGAAVGAVSGGLMGEQEDIQDEQNAIARNVAHQEEERQALARAVTNHDVAEMSQKKLSDALIINTIQTQGGAFDLSTPGIIGLKEAGVSETVIMAMQRHNKTR